MAILAIFSGSNITKEMYEALRKEVKWESNKPPGGLFHAAAVDGSGGMKVTDIWNSKEELDAFVNNRLMPAMQKLKVPAPKVEVFNIHNINVYEGIQKYKVN